MTKNVLEKLSDVNLLLFNASDLPERFFELSPSSKRKLIYSGLVETRMGAPGQHYAKLTPKALAILKAEIENAPIITTLKDESRRLRK